jgi:hypothetical protein
MASFNQSPLGQATIAASFSDLVTGSAAISSPVRAALLVFRATGNLGRATQYLDIAPISPRWRRKYKTIGSAQ